MHELYQKLWRPEQSHQSGLLETALCLLSIKMSIKAVCLCVLDGQSGGKMARKADAAAASSQAIM